MAADASFDIVSKLDMQEMNNAVQQAEKEIENRFDFKGSKTKISLEKDNLVVISDDEYKLGNVLDVIQSKMVKRGISLKHLDYGKIEPAASATVKQVIGLKQEIGRAHV